MHSIALSTCMRTEAMQRVLTISFSDSWDLPLRKGGIFSLTPKGIKSASISNHISAIKESPLSSNASIPLCLVSSLSEMEPENKLETNVMAPEEEIPIRPSNVLLFLQFENVICWRFGNDGFSIYTLVTSMMTHVVGYKSLKHLGMLAWTAFLASHNGISFSFKYRKLIHVVNILDIVAQDNPNRSARSCSRSSNLSLTNTKKLLNQC